MERVHKNVENPILVGNRYILLYGEIGSMKK